MTTIPQPVIEALAALRAKGNVGMANRKNVIAAVSSARVKTWLTDHPELYSDALNDMMDFINGANEPGAYDFEPSADCAACLRHRRHTVREHQAILARNRRASKGD